jgi:hypothetical protein
MIPPGKKVKSPNPLSTQITAVTARVNRKSCVVGLSGFRIMQDIGLKDIGLKWVSAVNGFGGLIEFQNQLPRVQAPK